MEPRANRPRVTASEAGGYDRMVMEFREHLPRQHVKKAREYRHPEWSTDRTTPFLYDKQSILELGEGPMLASFGIAQNTKRERETYGVHLRRQYLHTLRVLGCGNCLQFLTLQAVGMCEIFVFSPRICTS